MAATSIVRKLLLWILVVAVVGGGWWWWSRRGDAKAAETYRTDAVGRGTIHETVTATGTISAVTTVQVGSQVSGIVARLHADFNSRVRRGELIAELDPTPFQAALDQRRADLSRSEVQMRAAEIRFLRQKRLLEEKLSPEADYDAAQADFDAARAQVEQSEAALRQAETNLRYTKILSPIDGVVVDRQYDVGQTVAASFQAPTLFTIAQDLTKMQVQADVDQADIGKILVGQMAKFTVDAYPEQEFEGIISQVRLNATVNQNVITYPVILTVPNPEEKLRPNMTANVTIYVSTIENALRVPNAALRFRPIETESGGSSRAAPPVAARAEGEGRKQGESAADSSGTGASGAGAAGAGATGEGGTPPTAGRGSRRPGGPGRPQAGGGDVEREMAGALEGKKGLEGMGALMAAAGAGGPGGRRGQTVYILEGEDTLRSVAVRTGITDGRFTAILDGDLKEGDRIVVGLATLKVDGTGSFPGAGPGFGGRGRGRM